MFRLIKLELLKLWHTKTVWGYVLFFTIACSYLSFESTKLLNPVKVREMPGANPWFILLLYRYFDILLLVLISGLLTVVHFQLEYQNDIFKKIKTLPVSSFTFFLSKVMALFISILFFILLYILIVATGTYYNGLNNHSYNEIQILNYNYSETIPFQLLIALRIYICLWGYLAIVSMLNLYVRNSVLAAALVVLLWFANVSRLSRIIPSGFAAQSDRLMNQHFSSTLSYNFSLFKYEGYSLLTFVMVLASAYFIDRRNFLIKV